MNVMQVSCGSCAGIGRHTNYEVIDLSDDTSTIKSKETVCSVCNGKGYTEYAIFSIEEAKSILEHCGLSTEKLIKQRF